MTYYSLVLFIYVLIAAASANANRQCLIYFDPPTREAEISNRPDKATLAKRTVNEFRKELVESYFHLEVTSQKERRDFILSLNQEANPNRLVVEFENSKLKFLNDVLKDKDIITSIDNFANNYVLKKVEQWVQEHLPETTIRKYTDGKSLSLILDGKRPFHKNDLAMINSVFDIFQKDLANLLRSKKEFRDSDKIENWFRMGVGRTPDEAYFAARVSRKLAGKNQVIHFSNSGVRETLVDLLFYAEYYRAQVAELPLLSFLLETEPRTLKKVPNLNLFEILRKANTPEDIMTGIFDRFQIHLGDTEANRLFNYAEAIDLLNPKFFVEDQTVVTLANAVNGGIVIDRKGMGAANQLATAYATAIATAQSMPVGKEKLDLVRLTPKQQNRVATKVTLKFFKHNREQERLVTTKISEYRSQMETQWGAKCRGDDCVIEDLLKINIAEFLKSDLIRGQRVVLIPSGIPFPQSRSEMSTHGEAIEKLLVKRLYKYMKSTTMETLTFAIEFRTTELGTGPVNLIVGPQYDRVLDLELEKLIHMNLELAMDEFNSEQKKQNKETHYSAGEVVRL